jgi:hypothetical protein
MSLEVVGEQAPMVTLQSGALTLEIGLSSPRRLPARRSASCEVQAGTRMARLRHAAAGVLHSHVNYLRRSEDHTPIFELPAARPMEITALGETLPVYGGSFEGSGFAAAQISNR